MSTWRTILQVSKGKEKILSKEIFIECGIFQGDSLSPTLFGLAFIIISYTIRQMKLGYIPGPPGDRNSNQMKTHGLLMDDLKVYSTSHQQLEKVIQQTAYVMEKTGLNLGLDKCSVLTIKAGKECTTKSVKITDEKIIEGLKEGKFYEYLGMSQRADCQDKVIKDALKKEFYRRNRIVWKSLLSASNKVKTFNSICIGVLSYSFGVINWTKIELEEMYIRVRKEMTMNKTFNKHSDIDRLYLPRNRGGRGLICIKDFCDRMCVSTLGYVLHSKTIQGRTIKEHYMNKNEGTLLQKAENIVNALELDVLFTTEGNFLCDEQEISPKQLVRKVKKGQEKYHLKELKRKTVHGAFFRKAEDQGIDLGESFGWLNGKGLTALTESKVMALQEQEVEVKVTRKEIWKEQLENVTCKVCKEDRESVAHIMCGCRVLLKTEYFKRHDAMMRVIYCYLLQKLGFIEELLEWYRSDYVEKFKENDTSKLYWDFAFDTERSVEYNRPDIVVILKETKEMITIEGSTPGDMNLTPRTDDKCGKYFELASELKALHDLKSFKLIDIIIGATGTVLRSTKKNFLERFQEKGTSAMRLSQKAAILGTLDIFKKVLGHCH